MVTLKWWWWWSWPSYNSARRFLQKSAGGLCPCRYAIRKPEDLTSELNTCKPTAGLNQNCKMSSLQGTIKSLQNLDPAAWTLKVHKLSMGSLSLCASKGQISERRGRGYGCPAFLAWAESLSSRLSPCSKVGEQSHGMSLRGFQCIMLILHVNWSSKTTHVSHLCSDKDHMRVTVSTQPGDNRWRLLLELWHTVFIKTKLLSKPQRQSFSIT